MSLFGALDTAVSGLDAQSAAFSNISNNVANSQTVGFKETETSFSDLLSVSGTATGNSGSVATQAQYTNDVQGTIAASTDPTALAISGAGFFAVQQATSINAAGQTQFSPNSYYTRAGDFSLNDQGYLVNSAGDYLQGWSVNASTGAVNQASLQPVQIGNTQFNPVPTSSVSLSANLPATPATGSTTSSDIQVYDSLGTEHTLTVNWTQNSPSDWTATITSPDNTGSTTIGTAEVQFGDASDNGVADGTIGNILNASGGVTGSSFAAGGEATLTATANFGQGNQAITLDLGGFGASNAVTQFAGTAYQLNNVSQNGAPPGAYSGISINPDGNVVVNYDNGQSQTVAQVPIEVFSAPDALQPQSGQAYTATAQSGDAIAQNAGSGSAGTLTVGSVEQSNVDIGAEFSKLIVAQQAYGAGAKVVTTASDMLTAALDMKR